jgi:hypothetical protein
MRWRDNPLAKREENLCRILQIIDTNQNLEMALAPDASVGTGLGLILKEFFSEDGNQSRWIHIRVKPVAMRRGCSISLSRLGCTSLQGGDCWKQSCKLSGRGHPLTCARADRPCNPSHQLSSYSYSRPVRCRSSRIRKHLKR